VLAEVVADEHVEQVGVAAEVSVGQRDQLSVTGGGRVLGGTGEEFEVVGQQGRGHEQGCRGRVSGTPEDLGGGIGLVTDQAVKEGGVVVGHNNTVALGADGALTAADGRLPSQGAHCRRARRSRGAQGW